MAEVFIFGRVAAATGEPEFHAIRILQVIQGTEQAENTGTHGLKNKKSRRAESRPAGLTDFFSGGEGGIRIFYISI